tara:strand:- start:935 stop:1621 length:687 start_codon:yes stop_codon:yes gene_type:complete
MKFKIVFGIVMVTCMVSIYSIITTIAGGISENKAGLTRLNKSFLSLSEEFESVGRNAELIQATRGSYRNSLVDLSDRLDTMEGTNSEIYRILNDLDKLLNEPPVEAVVVEKYVEPEPVKDLGVNAGFGVLTGTQVTGQPEIIPEPEPVMCPKVSSSKAYGDYIENIVIKRSLKFTVIYDLFQGNITNVEYDGKIPNKVKQATFNYVMDLEFDNPVTITGCTLPFTINV